MWLTAGAAFFVYAAAVACVLPRLRRDRRALAITGAAVGLLLAAVAARVPLHPILRGLILPPALLFTAYWTSGLLFVAPMARAEQALAAFDRTLRIDRIAASVPRVLAEFLELSYAAIYPVIPIALVIHLLMVPGADVDRFWSVVLITDYVCFGMLPWVQTRPPRTLDARDPWRARARQFNVRLLGATSIQVNTFPSGHTAEALAAAVLVLGAPWPLVGWMFFSAAAISAGSVLGRYHFAADAIAGWLVALLVWLAVG